MARPPSAWYQCRKYAQRNRTLVASGAVLLVVLLASSVISMSLYFRAERESIKTQWEAYIANIAAAHSAIREGRAADARQFLKLAPVHRRGWEWRHLNGLLDRATFTTRGSAYVEDAIFSSDETAIITGDDDGHLHRYDVKTGELMAMNATAHDHWIHDLDLHPSRNLLAAASTDRTIGIYDAQTLETVNRFGPLAAPSRSVVWSRDGDSLFCGLNTGPILELDSEDGRIITRFEGHHGIVEKLVLSSDARMLISCSGDRTIRLWDTDTGLQLKQFETESSILSVCISPDDLLVAGMQVGGFISVFDIEQAVRIAHWRADVANLISCAFSADGSILATGSKASRLRLWETNSWQMVTELLGHASSIRSLTYSADGQRLLSASEDFTTRIWDIDTIGVDIIHDHEAWIYDVQVNADGTRVASSSGHSPLVDGTVRVFDLNDGNEVHRLESDARAGTIIFHLAATDDLSTIVTHFGSKIRLWRPSSNALIEFDSDTDSSSSALTPDGRYAAVAMWMMPRVHVIDLETEELLAIFDLAEAIGADTGLSEVAFSPSGEHLIVVAGKADKIVVLAWPDGHIEKTLTVNDLPDDPVQVSIAFSHDGKLFALALERRVELLEVATWTTVASLPFTARYAKLAFSSDDTRLFAGCGDGALRIWDLPSLRLVGTLYIHPESILDLDISKDGTTIVTGSIDTTIRVLKAPPGSVPDPDE